jgi:peptide-methionine (R)-S-oxide reductase
MSHRGGNRKWIENTLPAFRHSVQLGAHLLECDVRETKDKQIVVFHDVTIERMCKIPQKRISDYLYKDLPPLISQKTIEQQNDPDFNRIPLLEELLNEFPDYPIQIDLKRGSQDLIKKTHEMIKNRRNVLWGCFSYSTHHAMRKLDKSIPIFFPAYRILLSYICYQLGILSFFTIYESAIIMPEVPFLLNPGYIKALQSRNVKVIVFGDLNSFEKYDKMKKLGIDGVCTDDPELMKEWMQLSSQSRSLESDMGSKTEQEWRAILTPEQFRIIRQKGTETPGSGEYNHHFETGTYHCAACNNPLYTSNTKFDSGCGWPAFFDAIPGAITRHKDTSHGMVRIEIVCSKCNGHLGHVFEGEPYDTPTKVRHCVNSVSLKFAKSDD